MTENKAQKVTTQMLIRRPASEVMNAFVDPSFTKHFWFTKSTGSLKEGATVTWTWEMYGASAEVKVTSMIPNKLISIEWGTPKTKVDFHFEEYSTVTTYVTIEQSGFHQDGAELIHAIQDATGGFTTVLDGLKAYLEHGINLNLINDKYPKKP